MKRCVVIMILWVLFTVVGFGQNGKKLNKDLGINAAWSIGKITLDGGKVLEGLVYYNSNFGTIQYKQKENSQVTSYQEANVLALSFFDTALNRTRNYLTLHYKIKDDGIEGDLFFEVIREYENFAVLSRLTKAVLFFPTGPSDFGDVINDFVKKKKIVQLEGVFFLGEDNELELYTLTKSTTVDGMLLDYNKSQTQVVKANLLSTFTGEYWPTLNAYIEDNDLKPKRKSDLIRVLDEYDHLLAAEGL